jgi:DNA-binding transcriptional MocR family regulator
MLDLEQYQTERSKATGERSAERELAEITGSTAREIAASVESAIRDRLLDSGDPLPTVRALAGQLGTSPATVNSAYRILRGRGLVVAAGRRGTRVAPRPPVRATERPATDLPGPAPAGLRDLTIGLPDPELLPPLAPVLARVDLAAKLRISGLGSVDPELMEVARATFERDGVAAEAVAVVSGALDGIERVLQAHLRPGDRVLVEDPAYGSIRDILLALGLVAVPVAVDERGLVPDGLAAALTKGAEAALIVPRAQNPLGAALDQERAAVLQGVLERAPELLVVEDDHAGDVSGASFATTVASGRQRWALIRSMSKILHPDLRLALVTGDETTIGRVEGRQALGPRWVSHILQAIVAQMLRDPSFDATCAHAAEVYGARRDALLSALAEQGIRAYGASGLNIWVPVREESVVIRTLLDAGWLVMAGEHFRILSGPGVRITTATLAEREAPELAHLIAAAEHAGRSRSEY